MKVLNVCYADYANYSYANACAINAAGHYAKALTMTKHDFGYDRQAVLSTEKEILEQMRESDIIQIMHTCTASLMLYKKLGVKKYLTVYHTGTKFRQAPEHYNEVFNPIIDRGLTDQTEFMKLGIKNAAYVAVAIDTDAIVPQKEPAEKLILAHYPSRSQVKGTEKILKMLTPFFDKFEIKVDANIVPHAENLRRMQECDIYLELFAPMQGNKEYGCFGVTAFEAAAMGKIVITQNLNKNVYENAYGDQDALFTCPMTEELFEKELEFLSTTTHIKGMQKLTREMLVTRHSYEASGERIIKLIGL